MTYPVWQWAAFIALVLFLLVLDLGLLTKKSATVSFRQALFKSIFFVSLALGFNVFIYFWQGRQPALEFLTGYLIEESLSVDNLFVFIMIFSFFGVQPRYQHRVLFWGIMGALVMRGIFIAVGTVLLQRFHWIIYVFGALLIYSAVKMFRHNDDEGFDPGKNPVLKLARKLLPIKEDHEGQEFFVRAGGRLHATRLFIVLLVVETSDVMFAIDSIPAIFAITKDPFIIFTSNVFAIMGLRSLYFLLSSIMNTFVYLKQGVSVILGFVGVKMLIEGYYHIPIGISLAVIFTALLASILASLVKRRS